MVINVDAPPVENEQEALTLMIYHLRMAAMYFEATPTIIPIDTIANDFSLTAMADWIKAMEALYPDN